MALPNQAEEREADGEVSEPDEQPAEQAAKPEKPTVRENENDGTVSVDLNDRPARKERRGGRQSDLVERYRSEAESLRREMEAERNATRAHLARLEAQVHRPPPSDDPYKREIQQIRDQQEMIQTTIRSGTVQDPGELKRLRDQFYSLNDRSEQLAEERISARVAERVRRETSQHQGGGEEAILRAEFPDVTSHPRAMAWAYGRYKQIEAELAAEGKMATIAHSRQALQEAAENPRFAIRRPQIPAVSAVQQQRYGAVPAQAGAGGGGSNINLDKSLQKMARARWPELDDHEAFAKMAAILRDSERGSQPGD
jgi:hypothetical protein